MSLFKKFNESENIFCHNDEFECFNWKFI